MFNEAAAHASSTSSYSSDDALPPVFCWTKMGTEAGQDLEAILRRKEYERLSGDGLFAWGIGNSVGPAVRLARELGFESLDVLFTRMKSAPKAVDASPKAVVLWTAYESENGDLLPLPGHVLVTSRGNTDERAGLKRNHYALLCRSARSLLSTVKDQAVDSSSVRNLVSHNPTGASQVTAVVRKTDSHAPPKAYPVQFRARLSGPGFVRLAHPALLTSRLMQLYLYTVSADSPKQWKERVEELRATVSTRFPAPVAQQNLFS
ncbi:hypothetical protein [[Pseudomonas] boreopolis]|uniref:hypothetical protein n=1 Tax=Xanthomonas boreopolis TaxID=86183 RepID=UPI003D9AB957